MNIKKLKKIKVFLCIPATGKTYLSKIDSRFVDIDYEEELYKYGYSNKITNQEFSKLQGNGVIVNKDSKEYIQTKILEYLKSNKIVLSATHKHIIDFLNKNQIEYAIIQYSPKDVEDFKERMRKRGNSEEFIEEMTKYRAESYIKHKNNPNAKFVLDINKNQYVSDVLWKVFGKPTQQLTNLSLNNWKDVKEGFKFYSINKKYIKIAYNCFNEILNDATLKNKFINLYNKLYVLNELEDLWGKDLDFLFVNNVTPLHQQFITNLIILMGAKVHKNNIKKYKIGKIQAKIHKKRIKQCFLYDLEIRKYNGARVSQMLWAVYFINIRLIEIGVLQYEFDRNINQIKIHIPRMKSLDIKKVRKSLKNSNSKIFKNF